MPAVGTPGTIGTGPSTSVGSNSGGQKHLPGKRDPLETHMGPTSAGAGKKVKTKKRRKKKRPRKAEGQVIAPDPKTFKAKGDEQERPYGLKHSSSLGDPKEALLEQAFTIQHHKLGTIKCTCKVEDPQSPKCECSCEIGGKKKNLNDGSSSKWPVVWWKDSADRYAYFFPPNMGDEALRLSRQDAFVVLRGQFPFYEHLGNDVPKEALVEAPSALLEAMKSVAPEAPMSDFRWAPVASATTERLNRAKWIMDSGSGLDLVSWEFVKDLPPEHWHKLMRPIMLDTAGGESKAESTVTSPIDQLGEEIDALVLPSTPYVLSLGRRCQEMGYGFWWPPHGLPASQSFLYL